MGNPSLLALFALLFALPVFAQIQSVPTAVGPVSEAWGAALAGNQSVQSRFSRTPLTEGSFAGTPGTPRYNLLAPLALALEKAGHSPAEFESASPAGSPAAEAADTALSQGMLKAGKLVAERIGAFNALPLEGMDAAAVSQAVAQMGELIEISEYLSARHPARKTLIARNKALLARQKAQVLAQALAPPPAAAQAAAGPVDAAVAAPAIAAPADAPPAAAADEVVAQMEALKKQFALFDAARLTDKDAATPETLKPFIEKARAMAVATRFPGVQRVALHQAVRRAAADKLAASELAGLILAVAENARNADVAKAALAALDKVRENAPPELQASIDEEKRRLLAGPSSPAPAAPEPAPAAPEPAPAAPEPAPAAPGAADEAVAERALPSPGRIGTSAAAGGLLYAAGTLLASGPLAAALAVLAFFIGIYVLASIVNVYERRTLRRLDQQDAAEATAIQAAPEPVPPAVEPEAAPATETPKEPQ